LKYYTTVKRHNTSSEELFNSHVIIFFAMGETKSPISDQGK